MRSLARPLSLSLALSIALGGPALAQDRARRKAPPSRDREGKERQKKRKKRRAPRAPDAKWKVRKPVVVRGFSPAAGPPGTVVTIRGRHFDRSTVVRLNGRGLPVVRTGKRRIQVRIPRWATSDAFVVVKRGFPAVTASKTFTVIKPPRIKRFRPQQGDPGVVVRISGRNFAPGDAVLIGATDAKVISLRPRRIKIRIPRRATTGKVKIRRGRRVVAVSRRALVVNLPPPRIVSVKPTAGPPGTVVRIRGRHFDRRDRVFLAGRRLRVRKRSPRLLEVVIGKHRTGKIAIRGPAGRRAVAPRNFVVTRPPRVLGFSPRFGAPGTRLRVVGRHFISGDGVYIGNRALTVRTVTPTRIVCQLPAGVTSGPISVVRGRARFRARGIFRVILPPAITAVTPASGAPGTRVHIEGEQLLKGVSVLLAGRRLRIVRKRLPSHLWVKIPPRARSGQLVVVTRAGSARWSRNFTVSAFATIGAFHPLSGPPGTKVRISGRHFTRDVKVTLGRRPLKVVRVKRRRLWVVVPAGARSARFRVRTHGRWIRSATKFVVTKPAPELAFTFAPLVARRGTEVTLTLTPPRRAVRVFFNGRPLPKRIYHRGRRIVVTVPGDARSGFFEVEYRGRRYRARRRLRVRR